MVRCTVSDSCNLREHLNIWRCLLFRPRSTEYTERSASTHYRPVMHYFHVTIPVLKKKHDLCIAGPPHVRSCGKRPFAVSCFCFRPAVRIEHFSQCADFFLNFMLGEFYKNLSNYSFLDCKGTEKEALRCVLIRATT